MFWNPEYWELSESAKPFFELLREARVFFEAPATCAAHVNEIWENVPEWWASSDVQEAVQIFRTQYAFVGPRPLRDLKRALTAW
jgi:putative transferase (TIGR04331 family)